MPDPVCRELKRISWRKMKMVEDIIEGEKKPWKRHGEPMYMHDEEGARGKCGKFVFVGECHVKRLYGLANIMKGLYTRLRVVLL